MTPEEKRLQDEARNRASSDFGTGSMLMRPEDTSIQGATNDFMDFLNVKPEDADNGLVPGIPFERPEEIAPEVAATPEAPAAPDNKFQQLLARYKSTTSAPATSAPQMSKYQDEVKNFAIAT